VTSEELLALERISRDYPRRVVRLTGFVRLKAGEPEPLELLIFRGFSSCTTHPTAFDPDQSVLPAGAQIEQACLLEGPLNQPTEIVLVGPGPVEQLLDAAAWG
jgi:hypothetical protein